jgi:hypothetical protein
MGGEGNKYSTISLSLRRERKGEGDKYNLKVDLGVSGDASLIILINENERRWNFGRARYSG